MKIAKNPLSQNLARHFMSCGATRTRKGEITLAFNDNFKVECARIRAEIVKKFGEFRGKRYQFHDQYFYVLITPLKADPRLPHRMPVLENVRKIEAVLGLELWSLFLDSENTVSLAHLEPDRADLIRKIIKASPEQVEALRSWLDLMTLAAAKEEKSGQNNNHDS